MSKFQQKDLADQVSTSACSLHTSKCAILCKAISKRRIGMLVRFLPKMKISQRKCTIITRGVLLICPQNQYSQEHPGQLACGPMQKGVAHSGSNYSALLREGKVGRHPVCGNCRGLDGGSPMSHVKLKKC